MSHPALVSIPAAVAVILTVALFLRRMRESQLLGHQVAKDLGQENRAALKIVVDGHRAVMTDFATRMEKFADRQERLAETVTNLCSTIERDMDLRRKEKL